jgi:hypothetical protein
VGEKTRGAGDIYSSADYVLAPLPVVGKLPNGTTFSVPFYVLKPGIKPATSFVIRNTPDYYQMYKGLELTATKRMSNRWMLRGNFTFQNWTQHVGAGAIVDPTVSKVCGVCNGAEVLVASGGSGSKGNVYLNAKWASSLTGAYQIPVIETSFGFNLNSRQGYPDPYSVGVQTSTGEGTKTIMASPANDTFRNSTVTELDLRLAKDIRVSRVGLTLSIDMFNALNSNTILQRNLANLCTAKQATASTICTVSATSNRVFEVLSPRVFRLGARLAF